MINPLRIINKKYRKLNILSIEGFLFLFSIVAIPQILTLFIPINLMFVTISYFIIAIALYIDSYFMIKQEKKDGQ
jgi:hypothetical protein